MASFYLSRLVLDPGNRRVRREVGDFYQLHRTVLRAFPQRLPEGERVLFRLEENYVGQPLLLVQSQTEPDWDRLESGYLLPPDPFDPAPNPATKRVSPVFHPGQRLRFRLRANPTVKKSPEKGQQGRRVGIVREENQLAWLARKGAAGGFRPLDGVIVADMGRAFGLGRKQPATGEARPRARVELLVVQFDGLLEVTNPARFDETLLGGVGSAKGFGCGLLSLAPA